MFLSDKKWIDHPGSYIREELEAREWSQIDLAYILGCSVQSINLLVNEKKGISPEMAKSLAKAFSVSAEFLSNLQNLYDLSRAEEPSDEIERRAMLQRYPIKRMAARGWIEETNDVELMEEQLTRYFEVQQIQDAPQFAHAAKKTDYSEIPIEQLVWLFRVRNIAKEMVVPKYSKKAATSLVKSLKSLRNEAEQIRLVPKLLMEAGIRFAVVEPLKGSKIDGVCFWLNDKSPVIGMTTRFDRIDNFWFVLRHEIEHVIQGHGKKQVNIDVELEKTGSETHEEEIIANQAGADFCVPQSKMNDFYSRKKPYFYEKEVLAFSALQDVHPGLVVGQLHNRTQQFQFLRKYLVPIREYLFPSATVDGWGNYTPTEL